MCVERDTRKLIKLLKRDGWYAVRTTGHHQFRHPVKDGLVSIGRRTGDLPENTARSIYKTAGWL